MGQFLFGLLAGVVVGLIMEWVIDWTGLLPRKRVRTDADAVRSNVAAGSMRTPGIVANEASALPSNPTTDDASRE